MEASMTMTRRMAATLALVSGMAAGLLAASVSRAQAAGEQDAEARAIIDKAIKAHGGADKLSQFKAVSAKWAGKRKVENMFYWDAVYVVTYQMPDKIRFDAEVENPNGEKFSFSRVVNGKKGWQGWPRGMRDLKEAEVAQFVEEIYAHWLASLVPLKNKGFEFSGGQHHRGRKGCSRRKGVVQGPPRCQPVLRQEDRPGDQE
jgi:hypothetical protein